MQLNNSVLFINVQLTQQTISKCDILYNYNHNTSSEQVARPDGLNISRCDYEERSSHKEEI